MEKSRILICALISIIIVSTVNYYLKVSFEAETAEYYDQKMEELAKYLRPAVTKNLITDSRMVFQDYLEHGEYDQAVFFYQSEIYKMLTTAVMDRMEEENVSEQEYFDSYWQQDQLENENIKQLCLSLEPAETIVEILKTSQQVYQNNDLALDKKKNVFEIEKQYLDELFRLIVYQQSI